MFTCQWNVHFLNMVEHVLQKHVWELKTLCQSKLLLIIEEIFKSMHFHGCSHFSRMYTFSLSVEKHVLGSQGRRELSTFWEVLGIELSAAKQSSPDHACIAISVLSSTCKVHKQSENVKRANFSVCHCRAVQIQISSS